MLQHTAQSTNQTQPKVAATNSGDREELSKVEHQSEQPIGIWHRFGNLPVQVDAVPAIIQPKLNINHPDDPFEQEADRMAEQVMRMAESNSSGNPLSLLSNQVIQRKCTTCGGELEEEQEDMGETVMRKAIPITIQRKCSACEAKKDEENQTLMRKAAGIGGYEASPSLSNQLSLTKGSGAPLPESTRSVMENAFQTDFSHVRIHTDGQAAEMSRGIQARAFTHGRDIYFGYGEYAPERNEGKRLLAHELTHTLQQGAVGVKIMRDIDTDAEIQTDTESFALEDVDAVPVNFEQLRETHPDIAWQAYQISTQIEIQISNLDESITRARVQATPSQGRAIRRFFNYQRMLSERGLHSERHIYRWAIRAEHLLRILGGIIRVYATVEADAASAFREANESILSSLEALKQTDYLRRGQTLMTEDEERRAEREREPERLFPRVYGLLRRYVRSHWRMIQRHEANDLVARHAVLDILREHFGTDQALLAQFFQYLQGENPDLLSLILFNGRTARAFVGDRPILPSLGRVSLGILEGVIMGDVRDIYHEAPAEGSTAATDEPLDNFGAVSDTEEAEMESSTIEGGTMIGAIGVGLIPIVGQVADVRDLAANVYLLYTRPTEVSRWERWLALTGSFLGLVPLIGDALKFISRSVMASRRGFEVVARFDNLIGRLLSALSGQISEVRRLVREEWHAQVAEPVSRLWSQALPYIEGIAESIIGVPLSEITRIRAIAQQMFSEIIDQLRTRLDAMIRVLFDGVSDMVQRQILHVQLSIGRIRSLYSRISPTQRLLDAFSEIDEAEAVARRLLAEGSDTSLRLAQETLANAQARIDDLLREASLLERGGDDALELASDATHNSIPRGDRADVHAPRETSDVAESTIDDSARATEETSTTTRTDSSDDIITSDTIRSAEEVEQAGNRVGREVMAETDERAFREAGDREPPRTIHDDARKQAQLQEALIAARLIEETNDIANNPIAFTLFQLTALKWRYPWIERFEAESIGNGVFDIYLIGSRNYVSTFSLEEEGLTIQEEEAEVRFGDPVLEAVERWRAGEITQDELMETYERSRRSIERVTEPDFGHLDRSRRIRLEWERHTGTAVPEGYDIHHIIPENVPGETADRLRELLEDAGIDIHGFDNLVPLPSRGEMGNEAFTHHRYTHGDYQQTLLVEILEILEHSPNIRRSLSDIKRSLIDGRPLSRIR